MTAEVAVLNKSAVALAADSAMTVPVGRASKTYRTNKLFALTKHHPIGIMVYNNADFMNVPWETIVKMYREDIGSSYRSTVQQYAADFLRYVGNYRICTAEQQTRNLHRIATDLFYQIAHLPELAEQGSLESSQVHDVVARYADALLAVQPATSMQSVDATALIGEHASDINNIIDQYFSDLYVDQSVRLLLHRVLSRVIKAELPSTGHSGLVFAGFGEDDIFPSLVEVVVDGALGNTVKTYNKSAVDLARTGSQAFLMAFAQREMVGRFMNGVDIDFFHYFADYLRVLLTNLATDFLEADGTSTLTDSQLSAIQSFVETKLTDFRRVTAAFCQDRFVEPVLDVVEHLPKEELANMAEALVNLTSLKRRVSKEEETVGGPIDVAVISKGDGFIWIKRKHYFDPSLNRDYFVRQSLAYRTGQEANE